MTLSLFHRSGNSSRAIKALICAGCGLVTISAERNQGIPCINSKGDAGSMTITFIKVMLYNNLPAWHAERALRFT
eukprot:scaffold22128_cov16-Tisochrysis_lutea.AAC.1